MSLNTDRKKKSDALSLYATKEEIDVAVAENETEYFKIRFNFMHGHKGPRPGEFHLIFGTAGSGKSTLVRSIWIDCAACGRVLLWLSEEGRKDLMVNSAKQGISDSIRKNISILSEENISPEIMSDVKKYQAYYEAQIQAIKPGIVFFDNLTTSPIYESLSPVQQFLFFTWLKKFHKKVGIPIIAIGHTKAGVMDGQAQLIDLDDIRGTKSVSNGSPYVYILQRFKVAGKYFAFMRARKSRFHQHEGIFHLTYDEAKNCYTGDAKVDFTWFKEKFVKRERL